jgi:hypothetical protein
MNTAENHSNTSRMGRPPKPASEKKVAKSVYLLPSTLESLGLIDENISKAIEKLAAQSTGKLILEKD